MEFERSRLVLAVLVLMTLAAGVFALMEDSPSLSLAWAVTFTPTATPTATLTPTCTPTATPTATFTPTRTPTASATLTRTPVATLTASASARATVAATRTATPAPTFVCAASAAISFSPYLPNLAARSGPGVLADQVQIVLAGQAYTACAQSANGVWVQLDSTGAKTEWWLPAAFGNLTGSWEALPVTGPSPTPGLTTAAATPVSPDPPAYLSGLSLRTRQIYQYGLALGNNPRAFSKVGDCQATTPYFLAAFDSPSRYRLGETYVYLQTTLDQFRGAFARESVAAETGFGAAAVLDPTWTSNADCQSQESPLACEYRLNRPSLALISLGTNDIWQTAADYEADLRQIIEYSIRRGVLPILSTKADNVEGDGHINQVVRNLAAEYEIPLWDFEVVAQALPNGGLQDEYHLTWGQAFFDDPAMLALGWPWRNLTALQTLDTVWRRVR